MLPLPLRQQVFEAVVTYGRDRLGAPAVVRPEPNPETELEEAPLLDAIIVLLNAVSAANHGQGTHTSPNRRLLLMGLATAVAWLTRTTIIVVLQLGSASLYSSVRTWQPTLLFW